MTAPHSTSSGSKTAREAVAAAIYEKRRIHHADRVEFWELYPSAQRPYLDEADAAITAMRAALRTPALPSGEMEAWTDDKLNGWAPVLSSTDRGGPDPDAMNDKRMEDDMRLASNVRKAVIEECARLIESGAGMADLIDQDQLDQQAKYLRDLAVTRT